MISTLLHRGIVFFLVTVLLANNINTLIIVGDFIVNQASIAKNLCVQKDNQRGCNGKCHLRAELIKNASQSNSDTSQAPQHNNKRFGLDWFYLSNTQDLHLDALTRFKTKKIPFSSTKILTMSADIDTPPPNTVFYFS